VSGDVGRYRRVRSRLWIEPWFLALTEAERLVALYCLTGPPTNGLGLYRLVPEAAAVDFNVSVQTFRRRFDAVCSAFGWRFDGEARVLWIPAWLDENAPQSPNVVKSWRNAHNEVPACELKAEAGAAIEAFLKAKGEAFSEAFRKASPSSSAIRDQDQDQEQSQYGGIRRYRVGN
jgi:hypothetical protein